MAPKKKVATSSARVARGKRRATVNRATKEVRVDVTPALGDKSGVARFGSALVPLDEALVQVALDLSARPYLAHDVDAKSKVIGAYDTRLTEEFVRAFCQAAGATVHVRMLAGKNPHHI